MSSAQTVVGDMSGNAGALSGPGILRQIQQTQAQESADPSVKKAQQSVETAADQSASLISDAQKKLEGVDKAQDIQPWDAQQESLKYQTDPIKAFGSAGSLFAIFASAFSHRPMINALMGASAAMNAIKSGDSEAYERAYTAWKDNTDLAIKRHTMEMDDIKDVIDLAKTEPEAAMARLQAVSAKYENKVAAQYAQFGAWDKLAEYHQRAQQIGIQAMEARSQIEEAQAKLEPFKIYKQGVAEFESINKRAPNAQEKANIYSQSTQPGMTQTPEGRQAIASMVASGMPLSQVIPGFGNAYAQQRNQARQDALDLIRSQSPGMTAIQAGQELANRTVEYQSGKRSVGQLFTMLGATRQAVSQLDYNIEKTKEDMKKLPSSDISPVINAIARGEEKWTGNPAYSALFYHMAATAMESARILSGGQASVAQLHADAAKEASQWANANMTPASFMDPKNGVAKAMTDEGHFRLKTYEDAIGYQLKSTTGGGMGASESKYSVGQVIQGNDGKQYRVIGVDPNDPDDPDIEPLQ